MRVLTVRQPWAWAIIHGGKDIENRTQAWKYRGPVAIHAGAGWSDRGAASPLVIEACRRAPSAPMNPEWHLGSVIGVVDLIDIHAAQPELTGGSVYVTEDYIGSAACCDSPWAEQAYQEHGGRTRRDIVHLELANPRPLRTPVPARGRLGLWTPDEQLRAAIEEQLS